MTMNISSDMLRAAGVVNPALNNPGAGTMKPAAETAETPSFQDMLKTLLTEVDQAQRAADTSIHQLVKGDEAASIQDVVVRLEEADLAFRLMKEVRDKLVQAYKEVVSSQG